MDLDSILKKTKATSDRFKRNREPVYVATDDRPYEAPTFEDDPVEQKEPGKNLGQSGDKVETNLGQTRDKPETKLRQTRDKVETQLRTLSETKLRQTRDKVETNLRQSEDIYGNDLTTQYGFQSLVGLQRKLLIFVYQQCQLHRDKITPPLSMENIASGCNTTISSARKTLQRLEKRALLIRKYFKNGRGGWTQYELPGDVYQALFHSANYSQLEINLGQTRDKLETNLGQTRDKVETQLRTQLRTRPPSSSSNINITTTTRLPDEWLKISIEEAQNFGLTQSHLLQLYKAGGYDPKIVEDSIQHFLFDLEHNNKIKEIKTNPLSYFMGILKRAGAYTAPDNYEAAKDRAMRIYLEKQKAMQEKRAAMEKEHLNVEFQNWLGQLSEEEKNQIIPEEAKKMKLAAPKTAALRMYFEKTVWQTKKEEVLKMVMAEE